MFAVPFEKTHFGKQPPKYPIHELSDSDKKRFGQKYFAYEEPFDDEIPSGGRFWTKEEFDRISKGCGRTVQFSEKLGFAYCSNCKKLFNVDEFI